MLLSKNHAEKNQVAKSVKRKKDSIITSIVEQINIKTSKKCRVHGNHRMKCTEK